MGISTTSVASPFDRAASMARQVSQSVRQEFEQLGRDLQMGNLKAAQSDFATIQASAPFSHSSSNASANPAQANSQSQGLDAVRQAFSQLSQDLRAGNITAARQDYSTLQQDLQKLPGNLSAQNLQSPISKGLGAINQLVTEASGMIPGNYLGAALQAYSLLTKNQPTDANSTSAPGKTSLSTVG